MARYVKKVKKKKVKKLSKKQRAAIARHRRAKGCLTYEQIAAMQKHQRTLTKKTSSQKKAAAVSAIKRIVKGKRTICAL